MDENGCFRPNAPITRSEMAAIIASAMKLSIEDDESGSNYGITENACFAERVVCERQPGVMNLVAALFFAPAQNRKFVLKQFLFFDELRAFMMGLPNDTD